MTIRDFLLSREVWFETLLHSPAPSATRHAGSLHVPGARLAKGVLVRAGDAYVLAVLPATTRIDLDRLSGVLDGVPVRLATEPEVARVFDDCERGALPPFGRLYGVPTVVDTALAQGEEIVCLGNQRHEGLRLRFRDFKALELPLMARFAVQVESTTPPARRRAG